jgi:16S rRNA (uracil1498-N3)-methyltransferase
VAERFFTPESPTPGEYALAGPEAHHLAAVRRIAVGESIVLFSGDGREFPAEVVGVGKKSVLLQVGEPIAVDRERPVPLWIASAVPKGDRLDFLIEKLTELGVARFVPLIAERSAVRPKADIVGKYRRIVVEASKQCGRNVLMMVDPPIPWSAFVERPDLPSRKIVLHPSGDGPLSKHAESTVIAIGPEGGWSEAEIDRPGWAKATLGSTILRIETAGLAAAAIYSV